MPNPNIITQAVGYARNWKITARDNTGAVVTQYTIANDLFAKIWAGQDQQEVASPVATWIDPDAGTIKLAISEANTTAAGVGSFRCQVWVVNNLDQKVIVSDIGIEFTDSPGTADPLSTDISWYDLTLYVPQIRVLQDFDVDLAQFAQQRHDAQQWFRDQEIDRYRPQPGRSRRYLNAAMNATGPYLYYSAGPLGAAAPTVEEVAGYFANGGLIVTESIKKCQANYAAACVYSAAPGKNNQYQEQGARLMGIAEALFPQCVIELDTDDPVNDPLVAAIRVDRDVTWLT